MTKRINAALISIVAVAVAFMSAGSSAVSARHVGRHQQAAQRTHKPARGVRQRAHQVKSRRRDRRRAVAYVCPMHMEIRQRSRGTCPKCLMDLVAEPRGSKSGGM